MLGQRVPTVRFLPTDYMDEKDVIAARAASDVVPIIDRNNKFALLNLRAAYLQYTHGICGFYTRYLESGSRFGWKQEPDIELQKVKLEDAFWQCPLCIQNFPPELVERAGLFSPRCPRCHRPFDEDNFVPPNYAEIPMVRGTIQTPRGQEVITVHGGLELRLPAWAGTIDNMPYLGCVYEVHRAQLLATYGDRAKNIQGGYGSGPYDTWDRFARLALYEPTVSYYSTSNQNLVTFKQYWLTPDSFFLLSEQKRDALLKIFPDGAYIAFAMPDRLLDARNERLKDHWVICQGMEGPGTYTPALGMSAISVQKRYNVIHNFIMEWLEYAAAGFTFVNSSFLSSEALTQTRRAPGMIFPLRVPMNVPMENVLKETQPQPLAGQIFQYAETLESVGEFVTSAVPTVSGGTEAELKPTTYLADRESAMGRLYIPWLHLRTSWADVVLQAVKEFARWRTDDERYALFGPRGEIEGKQIIINDLQGDFEAYPETNENFPVLWHQLQAMVMQLMQSPMGESIFTNLNNIQFLKETLQLPDVYIPGEDDKVKQQQEISILLTQRPVPQMNPQTGQQTFAPSIPIDPFEDNHLVHAETVKAWAVSPIGIEVRKANPLGYLNVIAHGKMHEAFLKQQEMQNAQMQQMTGQAPHAPGARVAGSERGAAHGPRNVPPRRNPQENSTGQAQAKMAEIQAQIGRTGMPQ